MRKSTSSTKIENFILKPISASNSHCQFSRWGKYYHIYGIVDQKLEKYMINYTIFSWIGKIFLLRYNDGKDIISFSYKIIGHHCVPVYIPIARNYVDRWCKDSNKKSLTQTSELRTQDYNFYGDEHRNICAHHTKLKGWVLSIILN